MNGKQANCKKQREWTIATGECEEVPAGSTAKRERKQKNRK